ncbi:MULTISPECIES: ABC transporter ATP-binding protein [unclassified Romboutsia]|uniref:ABC transporter ATP-binding protein n=1 Tax=unclassified Romboutsia TaxID=2626894 RepID=UPI000821F34B|nr:MULTISPECIES: ABC transporter ATP-binding protein [unclassified Romboutsia]SCH02147.1 Daunorubicin/doxorubicin resistance ATP-binding protein DrrA [uncultured Clostridium sp.]
MYILQVKNLHKRYDDFEAIKGINLDIKKCEIYGLLGPNGAGKSTLIKSICGLEKITCGEIIFEEKENNVNKYKRNIGLLPQDIAIYNDFTAKENVSFFCSLYGYNGKELKKRVNKALEFVGLLDVENKVSKNFSGGMKRRLNMACAIAHSPKLIIMDEPTVGIDPQSRNHILQSVKKLNEEGSTIIYTSHYMEEVEELCTNISIMDNGKIIANGSKEYLKSSLVNYNTYTINLKNEIYNIDKYIRKIEGVQKVEIDKNKIKCYYSKDKNITQKLINIISNHSGVIENIKSEIPTLESVFLTLTGKKLRD